MSSSNNSKWEYMFYSIIVISVLTFFGFIITESDNTAKEFKYQKAKQIEEINATIIMLVEVAYKSDTARFTPYQKGILKAVIANDVHTALKNMAPHKHKALQAGDAVLDAFKESPEYPIKP